MANKLKNQQKGKFPSDTEQNLRDHCKAITLRNGKKVESSRHREEKREEDKAKKEVETKPDRTAEVVPTRCNKTPVHYNEGSKSRCISFPDKSPIISPPLLHLQQFPKKKLDTQFSKFLEIFKKIHINILFTDALEQVLNYMKFMMEVMAKKRKLKDYKTVKLIEECSTIL